MKVLAQVTLMLVMLLLNAASAYSCSCADPSPREKFRAAKAVFVGKIIDVKPSAEKKGDLQYFPEVVKFSVEKQWKGARKSEIIVLASYDWIGMCGDLELIVGEQYLVYAHRKQGRLVIHRDCGPNMFLRYAADEIKVLDRL
jgi:hypothetical protein